MRSAAANNRTPATRIALAVFMDAPPFERLDVPMSNVLPSNFHLLRGNNERTRLKTCSRAAIFDFPAVYNQTLRLIRRWLLCIIDDENVDLTLGRFEFQSKLLLNRCGERGNWVRRGCRISNWSARACD